MKWKGNKNKKLLLTLEDFKKKFTYYPNTGDLIGNKGTKRKSGIKVETTDSIGNPILVIKNVPHLIRNLAIFYMTGVYPEYRTKNIDGDKMNVKYNNIKVVKPNRYKIKGVWHRKCTMCGKEAVEKVGNFDLMNKVTGLFNAYCRDCKIKKQREANKKKTGEPLKYCGKRKEWVFQDETKNIFDASKNTGPKFRGKGKSKVSQDDYERIDYNYEKTVKVYLLDWNKLDNNQRIVEGMV